MVSKAAEVLAQGTRPYRPSNGCEGMDFMEEFCFRCKREAEQPHGCPIQSDTWAYEADDPKYPKEWVQDVPFGNPRCTAFAEDEP